MKLGVHNMKIKSNGLGGIEKEQKRLYKDVKKYKNDVNPELSNFNVYVHQERSWRDQLKPFIERHQEKTGKKLRKDAVLLCSTIQSVPASWPKKIANKYFKRYDQFLIDFLTSEGVDPDCFVSSSTHHDETSPHHTVVWIPFKNGKFQAKSIVSRSFLRELQKKSFEFYLDFAKEHPDLETMEMYEIGNDVKHLNEQRYKISKLNEDLDQMKQTIREKQKDLDTLKSDIASQKLEKEAQTGKIKKVIEEVKEIFSSLTALLSLIRLIARFPNEFYKVAETISKNYDLDEKDWDGIDVITEIINDPEAELDYARAVIEGEELDR